MNEAQIQLLAARAAVFCVGQNKGVAIRYVPVEDRVFPKYFSLKGGVTVNADFSATVVAIVWALSLDVGCYHLPASGAECRRCTSLHEILDAPTNEQLDRLVSAVAAFGFKHHAHDQFSNSSNCKIEPSPFIQTEVSGVGNTCSLRLCLVVIVIMQRIRPELPAALSPEMPQVLAAVLQLIVILPESIPVQAFFISTAFRRIDFPGLSSGGAGRFILLRLMRFPADMGEMVVPFVSFQVFLAYLFTTNIAFYFWRLAIVWQGNRYRGNFVLRNNTMHFPEMGLQPVSLNLAVAGAAHDKSVSDGWKKINICRLVVWSTRKADRIAPLNWDLFREWFFSDLLAVHFQFVPWQVLFSDLYATNAARNHVRRNSLRWLLSAFPVADGLFKMTPADQAPCVPGGGCRTAV